MKSEQVIANRDLSAIMVGVLMRYRHLVDLSANIDWILGSGLQYPEPKCNLLRAYLWIVATDES